MTREEAHEELHFGDKLGYIDFNLLHIGIEQIYDDFENRSCNSCKSIKQDKDIPSLTYCSKGIAEYQSESYPSVGKDFYCNRWEAK